MGEVGKDVLLSSVLTWCIYVTVELEIHWPQGKGSTRCGTVHRPPDGRTLRRSCGHLSQEPGDSALVLSAHWIWKMLENVVLGTVAA